MGFGESEVETDGVRGQSGEVDHIQFVQSCQSAEGCTGCELGGCVVSDIFQGRSAAKERVFVDSHQELGVVGGGKSACSRRSENVVSKCGRGK